MLIRESMQSTTMQSIFQSCERTIQVGSLSDFKIYSPTHIDAFDRAIITVVGITIILLGPITIQNCGFGTPL